MSMTPRPSSSARAATTHAHRARQGLLARFLGRGAPSAGAGTRRRRGIATIVAVFLATLGVGVAAALASKGVSNVFGSFGSGDGELNQPRDIAVNESTGDIYVVEQSNHRISVFDPDGEFVEHIGSQGPAEGEFDLPQGIAIDQDTGDVFVTDRNNRRVQKFDADGDFERTWGWGVDDGSSAFQVCTSNCEAGIAGSGDGQLGSGTASLRLDISPPDGDPNTGSVYVADPGNRRVQEFDLDGAFLDEWGEAGSDVGEFGTNQPLHVAVDDAGIVYMSDSNASQRIQRYDTGADDFLPPITTADVPDLPTSATNGLEIDPGAERLFASRGNTGIHELDVSVHPPTHVTAHMVDLGINLTPQGIGLNADAGVLYASRTSPQASTSIFVIDDVGTPTGTVTGVLPTAHTATLDGEVDPSNSYTAYRFEVSDDDGDTWRSFPQNDVVIGGGTIPIAVSEQATHLQANTEHRVRLIASQVFGPDETTSPELTFTTTTTAPEILVTARRVLGPTEASLRGRIQPHNSDTDYHFEWGTDQSYGETTPVTDIGAGNEVVRVAEAIGGLEPGTTYHFRLVASSDAGLTEGPDRTFTTPEGPVTRDERAYELVTPVDKQGGEPQLGVVGPEASLGVSPQGDAVLWGSSSVFLPGSDGAARVMNLLSTRDETGWRTQSTSPRMAAPPAWPLLKVPFYAEDLSKVLVQTPASMTPEAEKLPDQTYGLYLRDNSVSPAAYTLLSEPDEPLPPPQAGGLRVPFTFGAATPDLGHVVFRSDRELLSGAPAQASYEWADGELRIASVLPDGSLANGFAGARPVGEEQHYPGANPISEDGTRIYWTHGSTESNPLYLRENAAETKLVSGSERAGDDPDDPRNVVFLFATADGSEAFFRSFARLTDDATSTGRHDLYRWSADAPEGERLTNLTPGPVVKDGEGGGVIGDVAATDDGSHFYFVATGELADGAESGEENLYLWRRGEGLRHVATLSMADRSVWAVERTSGAAAHAYRDARLSEDGNQLLFLSRESDLTDHDTAGTRQAYLYDADADEITCVSCSPLSEPSTADVDLLLRHITGSASSGPIRVPISLPRNLSEDGSRVFFETDERLVPEDTNDRRDVYEWHEGELKLVSDGVSRHRNHFVGASADGSDAFFQTRARLSGWDRDNLADVYRATLGETFPEPRPDARCSGDECQGASPTVPGDLEFSSAELEGRGNPQAVTLSARSLPNRAARRLARGKPVAVRADVTGPPGRIAAVARANLRRGMVRAGRATAQVREAGRVVIRGLRLRPRALRVLRQRGQLRVRIVVRYAGEQDGQRVNLRRPGRGGRR